jgi:hypothetical protein
MPRSTPIPIGVPTGLAQRLSERKTRLQPAQLRAAFAVEIWQRLMAKLPWAILRGFWPGQGETCARLASSRLARTRLEPECPGSHDRRPPKGGQRSQLVSTAALAAISLAAVEPVDLRLARLRQMVLDSMVVENSKRNYAKALDDLFLFAASRPLTRALSMEWRAATDKLVTEARRNGMLGAEEAANLDRGPEYPGEGKPSRQLADPRRPRFAAYVRGRSARLVAARPQTAVQLRPLRVTRP